ncbi:MAG: TM2 domain-containing protein [Candidatus Gastranaerophilales bacterium]|nr:TM2 domain-containing protein [Candidatus Gastranaerophilales bacterium]
MFCKNCGKEIDDKAVVCIHCGCATGGTNINMSKDWLITLLLCLFLGVLGAHRFYTGHTGTGIVMAILTITGIGAVVTGIWAIVDLIFIALDNFKTADGRIITRIQ